MTGSMATLFIASILEYAHRDRGGFIGIRCCAEPRRFGSVFHEQFDIAQERLGSLPLYGRMASEIAAEAHISSLANFIRARTEPCFQGESQ